MQEYRTVLVALDVFNETSAILERAFRVAGKTDIVHLIYVAYPQTHFEPYGVFLDKDYSEEIVRQAREKLNILALRHTVPDENVHLVVGSPAEEIKNAAEELKADLIVIGTRGQKGKQRLLGSTANAVLHGAKVDILTVQVTR